MTAPSFKRRENAGDTGLDAAGATEMEMGHLSWIVTHDPWPMAITSFHPTHGSPIHFMFGSSVGFSRSADRMALFPVEL